MPKRQKKYQFTHLFGNFLTELFAVRFEAAPAMQLGMGHRQLPAMAFVFPGLIFFFENEPVI